MQTIKLHNIDIPKLGFGTWQIHDEECVNAVGKALQMGYRHIDTAQAYDNEEFVGEGWQKSGIPRDNFFLTTKIFREQFETKDKAISSLKESLNKLKTDYVDLVLVHWPFPEYEIEQLIEPLMEAQDKGLTRLIGVSNFTVHHMEDAKRISDNRICMNQVEYHPKLNQEPVLDFVRENGWGLTAYSPLGRGTAMEEQAIQDIADKHEKTQAQIILRWLIQQDNVLAIPKSSNEEHMASNFSIFDFELTSEDMETIFKLRHANDRQVNPDFAPAWDKAA
jgi:diketogulonate reductase-like aldo/keto reductase